MNISLFKTKYMLSVLILVIVGVVCLFISQVAPIPETIKPFFTALSSTAIVSGTLGLMNKFFLTNELVNLVLEKIKLKRDIDKTGIESIYTDINRIPYSEWFKSAKKIDIVHVYGQTWTNTHFEEIASAIQNNCTVRVVLLSMESKFIIPLADQYSITEEELYSKMSTVNNIWKKLYNTRLKSGRKKKLSVYYHKGMPALSLYRIDDRIVVIQSKITKGRTSLLPAYVCNDLGKNSMYHLYQQQIDELIKNSEKVNLEEEN